MFTFNSDLSLLLLFKQFKPCLPPLDTLQTQQTRGVITARHRTSQFQNRLNPRTSQHKRLQPSVQINHKLSLVVFVWKNRRSRNKLGHKIQFLPEIAPSFFLWLHPRWRTHWVAQVHQPSPAFARPPNSNPGHSETSRWCRLWYFYMFGR